MADINILKNIESVFTRLASPEGRVQRLSYTEKAYGEGMIEGADQYRYGQEQNIPLLNGTDTSDSVLDNGFRAQGASISRNFQNHFIGRLSFNTNMIVDTFLTIFKWLYRFIAQAGGLYTDEYRYYPGDVAFTVDEYGPQVIQAWYERTETDEDGTEGVHPSDPTRWRLLRERSALSITIPQGANLAQYVFTGVFNCPIPNSVSGQPGPTADGLTPAPSGPFTLTVNGDLMGQNLVTQEITYRNSGLAYAQTIGPDGIVQPWFLVKNPAGLPVAAVRGVWALKIGPNGHLLLYYDSSDSPPDLFINGRTPNTPVNPDYPVGHLLWGYG